MGKRICIVGGAGFVGRALVRQAIESGHQVVVTTRHPARARDLLVQGVQVLKADVITGKGLSEAVQNCDCVVNLVGLLFERGKNTFTAAHVAGAEHIVAACEAAGVAQLLHMSALLSEQGISDTNYGATKAAAEAVVQQSSLQWTIFRPSLIFGAQDSFLMRFKALSAVGPILPVIAGDARFQPIWVEDVARAFVMSIGNTQSKAQVYTLAGQHVYTFKTILSMWMQSLGRCRLFLAVPSFAASLLALLSNFLPTPLITRDQLKLLKHDNVATAEAFPAAFGSTTPLEALLPTLASGGQAVQLQKQLAQARTRYRQS